MLDFASPVDPWEKQHLVCDERFPRTLCQSVSPEDIAAVRLPAALPSGLEGCAVREGCCPDSHGGYLSNAYFSRRVERQNCAGKQELGVKDDEPERSVVNVVLENLLFVFVRLELSTSLVRLQHLWVVFQRI